MDIHEHRKALIHKLLEGLETGDPEAATVVDETRYIQHNPQTSEGSAGLAELFARLAKTNPKVRMVRVFADGDHVFAHMEYDFSTRRVAFEVFRFDGEQAVEHWDNIQPRRGPNPSGRSMTDGVTEVSDSDDREANRALVRGFVERVLVGRELDDPGPIAANFVQHDPDLPDGWEPWREALSVDEGGAPRIQYHHIHRVLAEGSFVLTVSEGRLAGTHTAFYDLFRVDSGRIVEHWNTVEHVAPRAEWKNDNGKF